MKELAALLGLPVGARMHAVDLHVHTPASRDMDPKWAALTPAGLIQLARDRDLEAIAITDHNTVAWCDVARDAAAGTGLTVLPGVEISTSEGHLLAIFDAAKPTSELKELLIQVGIRERDFGNLEAIAADNITEAARRVEAEGGIAVAAHVDRPKGFWELTKNSGARRKKIYASADISAFELLDLSLRARFEGGTGSGYSRQVTCIQGSDCFPPGGTMHEVDAIGARRTFLSMGDVTIVGLRQALLDPQVRVRLAGDERPRPSATIEGMWVSEGFLGQQFLRFSSNITCLIGGTGSGKSLSIELIRLALGQQVEKRILPQLSHEVERLLGFALGSLSTISLLVRKGDERYLIEHTESNGSGSSKVSRVVGETTEVILEPFDLPTFFPIRAFSQGEVIEFAREPLARLSLLDDLIDIDAEVATIKGAKIELRRNASEIIAAQAEHDAAHGQLKELPGLDEEVGRLSALVQHPSVKEHQAWLAERDALGAVGESLRNLRSDVDANWPTVELPFIKADDLEDPTPTSDLVQQVDPAATTVSTALRDTKRALVAAIDKADKQVEQVTKTWQQNYDIADAAYQAVVASLDPATRSQAAINLTLTTLRTKQTRLKQSKAKLDTVLAPKLITLQSRREGLLNDLQNARKSIRTKRTEKAEQLSATLDQQVVVRVRGAADPRSFLEVLRKLRVGSFVQEPDLGTMAELLHPVPFAKGLLAEDYDSLSRKSGLPQEIFRKFRENIVTKERLADLYEAQLVDVEDVVRIQFAIESQQYRDLEDLAHGQKCTVVLMIALAEGDFPLLVDQPEDALHAPWIEGYIVSALRRHRGVRQSIFATRSANVLVSADAEQIIALQADASRGTVVESGSLDRFSTRDLVLYHVEGGETAFSRRQAKYAAAKAR